MTKTKISIAILFIAILLLSGSTSLAQTSISTVSPEILDQVEASGTLVPDDFEVKSYYQADGLLIMTPAELTEYIQGHTNPRNVLVASHNLIHIPKLSITNTDYQYDIGDMTSDSLREEIMRLYSLEGTELTSQELQELDDNLDSLNNTSTDLSRATALILRAMNDAADLTQENLALLTPTERTFIERIDIDLRDPENPLDGRFENLPIADQNLLQTIINKIDHSKTTKGAGYIIHAVEIAKPTLDSVADNLSAKDDSLIPSVNAIGTNDCADGPVNFQDGLCMIVIGSLQVNTYHTDQVLSIDPGTSGSNEGNDTYNNNAGGVGFMGGVSAVVGPAVVVDLGGDNTYRCTIRESDLFRYTCGSAGLGSIGIVMDYGNRNEFNCRRSASCGSGFGGGVGMIYQAFAVGSKIGVSDQRCKSCIGEGSTGGIGISLSSVGGNIYYCDVNCVGAVRQPIDPLIPDDAIIPAVGVAIDLEYPVGGSESVNCNSNCNGFGTIGISNMQDDLIPECPDGTTGEFPNCEPDTEGCEEGETGIIIGGNEVCVTDPECPDYTTGTFPICTPNNICEPGGIIYDNYSYLCDPDTPVETCKDENGKDGVSIGGGSCTAVGLCQEDGNTGVYISGSCHTQDIPSVGLCEEDGNTGVSIDGECHTQDIPVGLCQEDGNIGVSIDGECYSQDIPSVGLCEEGGNPGVSIDGSCIAPDPSDIIPDIGLCQEDGNLGVSIDGECYSQDVPVEYCEEGDNPGVSIGGGSCIAPDPSDIIPDIGLCEENGNTGVSIDGECYTQDIPSVGLCEDEDGNLGVNVDGTCIAPDLECPPEAPGEFPDCDPFGTPSY